MIKFVIKKISFFQRMHTLSEILQNTTMKMFFFQVFNTVSISDLIHLYDKGVIQMLVNWNLQSTLNLPDDFPILTGDYTDFTSDWYQKVGMSLVSHLLLDCS